jgi:putative membrane protein
MESDERRTSFGEAVTARAMRLIARAVAAGRLAMEASGCANVPREGPLILAARHYHHLFDGIALFLTTPRHIHILVALDWAPKQPIKTAMEALTRAAQWPVILRPDAIPNSAVPYSRFTDREIGRRRRAAVNESLRLLQQGRALVIFPEGYPNIDPHLPVKKEREEILAFKGGFTAIAAAAERRSRVTVPILPVGLHYRRNGRWKVCVRFGTPVTLAQFSRRADLIRHVEREVERLSR